MREEKTRGRGSGRPWKRQPMWVGLMNRVRLILEAPARWGETKTIADPKSAGNVRGSFCPKAFDRVDQRRAYRQETDGKQRDQQGYQPCQYEDPPVYIDPVGKALQPSVTEDPGQWGGDQEGQDHQFQTIL